jgi:protein TonB
MHRGISASPSAAPIAAASQTTTPDLPAPTSVGTPPVVARATEEEVPPSAPVPTPVSEVPIKESAVAPPPPAPQSVRRAASTPEVNQPDHVDMRQPDRSAQRSLPIHDLKMSAPTVESRSGRLVDASVPNIGDAPTTSAAIGAPGGGLIPPISRANNPPAPPVPVVGLGSSWKTATEPKLISSTRPMYPQLAKQGNVEGDVVVSADIDATGKVAGAKVVSGPMYLRQAAVDAVQNWKYEPAMLNGRPTSAQITIKIQFRLK